MGKTLQSQCSYEGDLDRTLSFTGKPPRFYPSSSLPKRGRFSCSSSLRISERSALIPAFLWVPQRYPTDEKLCHAIVQHHDWPVATNKG